MDKSIFGLFKYAYTKPSKFEGRACRMEFNSFLIGWILIMIAYSVFSIIFASLKLGIVTGILTLILFIYIICSIVPIFGLYARRLHDMNLTGWLQLLFWVPIANIVLSLVMMCVPGTEGPNEYGNISENY